MRAVIQRTSSATVTVNGTEVGAIGTGLLILLGVEEADDQQDVEWLSGKIARMRIFPDDAGLMNRSISEIRGEVLVVSQFTLHASTRKGNRPSFIRAAQPGKARELYVRFNSTIASDSGCRVATGEFGGDMKVSLVNDGPVTIVIDSRARE